MCERLRTEETFRLLTEAKGLFYSGRAKTVSTVGEIAGICQVKERG